MHSSKRSWIVPSVAFVAVAASTVAACCRSPWRSGDQVAEAQPAPSASVGPEGCPLEMAFVSDGRFCVDKWEAHVKVLDGGAWTTHPFFQTLDAVTATYRAASAPDVKPQAYISGKQAAAACAAAGKRLCSFAEYRTACRGPAKSLYPYGPTRVPGTCNDARPAHPFGDLFGNAGDASLYDKAHLDDPRLDQLPGTVAESGSHPGCVSGYGAYDMVGNLHEWIDDPEGTFLGGYYNDVEINGAGCLYQTTAHTFDYHDYSTGFRCCASPPP